MESGMDMHHADQLEATKPPVAMVAQAPIAGRERAMGVCLVAEMTQKDWLGVVSFDPAETAATYMKVYAKRPLTSALPFDSTRITRRPAHGTLTREKNAVGDIYAYLPNIGYLGKDTVEAVVPVGSDTVRIIYNFVVQPNPTEREDFDSRKFCPKLYWKISFRHALYADG